MVIVKITTHITGLDYLKTLKPVLKGIPYEISDQVMDSIDILAKSSFEDVYQNTPFIHATGRYHDAVQFIRGGKRGWSKGGRILDIQASIPYSDCLECGHGTFAGYWIIERMRQKIEREVPLLIRRIAISYWEDIAHGRI